MARSVKKERLQLPETELSLSLLIGIEGERYLNIGQDPNALTDYPSSENDSWLKMLLNYISPIK